MKARTAKIKRHTLETQISLRLNLDGKGKSKIRTGIPFFDHMLTLFAKHATVDLELVCHGDLAVDAHHTVEDCGIALGQRWPPRWATKKASAATVLDLSRKAVAWASACEFRENSGKLTGKLPVPLTAKPMCRWTNVSRVAWWISAAGRIWCGAG